MAALSPSPTTAALCLQHAVPLPTMAEDMSRSSSAPYPPPPLSLVSSAGSLKPSTSHRTGTRYKEKFQALREKYDQVTTAHTEYERALARADDKLKRLQEECNLLLDAVDIAVPAQPSLVHYLKSDPIAPPYYSYTVPVPPAGAEGPPPPRDIPFGGPPAPPQSPHVHPHPHQHVPGHTAPPHALVHVHGREHAEHPPHAHAIAFESVSAPPVPIPAPAFVPAPVLAPAPTGRGRGRGRGRGSASAAAAGSGEMFGDLLVLVLIWFW
ncbi:hypothetical protein BD311DRAFT_792039 [Dichomitus squalens]|uniref:Uncharacterized protein n=2 Tax=Dichomitus squalens TaxID=114155 RepID=A0A4Q9M707_9APHY|nr:hypothetical protein BD311DRAFT_792039 [Dichomitus squalens]